ncbi:hypothetical protein GPECTOR_1g131 [Gonium pectorale]|uniref:Uncharacterized protein n=1 Tax=Gonium pectorale TaxID=33097 RepID=A0A150H267_GONPE|nr:hypothetical protein GPECTOR_1g131 [Gonium pectorale]|eukprot:KXZ56154.1 hypothetical protein GPECTOR_1g131 [Gonium pectorale]
MFNEHPNCYTTARASALQQALHDNPQLWHLLMSQLYGRGVVAGRGPGGGGGGGAGEVGGGDDEDEGDDEDGRGEVSCRMA